MFARAKQGQGVVVAAEVGLQATIIALMSSPMPLPLPPLDKGILGWQRRSPWK
ncbi:MAG: hypothetical protein GY856_28790 [bacterium]|nr:hypothetical protein [bacterium]